MSFELALERIQAVCFTNCCTNHVDTVHECDRQTDKIVIAKTVQRIASHGKNVGLRHTAFRKINAKWPLKVIHFGVSEKACTVHNTCYKKIILDRSVKVRKI